MKNGLLIWNVLLTLVAGYLLIAHFGNKKAGKPASVSSSSKDTLTEGRPFRIAYFEMDSVENNFDMVKDIKAEISKKDDEYSRNLARLDNTYRKRVQEYQQKGETMTQADFEKAQLDLRQLEERLKGERQGLDQQYQEFVTKRNLSLKKAIEDFIAGFNKDRYYSYIVVYESGLFYYKDSAYDITPEVVKGLNETYRSEKK